MKVLITGVAGFIGMHVARRLLERGDRVVGIDNFDPYYDVRLKRDRVASLGGGTISPLELDVADREAVERVFATEGVDAVLHLAAQAGVRHSLRDPHAYVRANLVGFHNVLDAARHAGVRHFVYASSSSVYGGNAKTPFAEADAVDHPFSIYAATKRSNELIAHSYSHLYGLPTTGLRFFTVYGPWGRPDMALFLFTKAILEDRPIDVFNHGRMRRDFTYIDDIVEGVVRVLDRPATPDETHDPKRPLPAGSDAPFRLLNIGNHASVPLMDFIRAIEAATGREARKNFLPMQDGDVPDTFADVERIARWTGFRPQTRVEEGVGNFVAWYRGYYGI